MSLHEVLFPSSRKKAFIRNHPIHKIVHTFDCFSKNQIDYAQVLQLTRPFIYIYISQKSVKRDVEIIYFS